MIQPSYTYRAIVERVIDGDTIDVAVDLGFSVWRHGERLRLLDVHAPEMTGPDKERGNVAKTVLALRLPKGEPVIIATYKDKTDKYGRMIADVYRMDGQSVNNYMRANAPTGGK